MQAKTTNQDKQQQPPMNWIKTIWSVRILLVNITYD